MTESRDSTTSIASLRPPTSRTRTCGEETHSETLSPASSENLSLTFEGTVIRPFESRRTENPVVCLLSEKDSVNAPTSVGAVAILKIFCFRYVVVGERTHLSL